MFFLSVFAASVAAQGVVEADLVQVVNPVVQNEINLATIFQETQELPFSESLANKWTYYCANLSIGTPGQSMLVQLDTGSSDLWVPGKVIKPDGFSSSASTSFRYLYEDFYVRYIKDFAQGYWGTDTVQFGSSGVKLHNQPFGIATHIPESTIGILGIGPSKGNTSVARQLVSQGVNRRNAYSIYLGDKDSKTGKILFGGVDEAKFHNLTTAAMKSNTSFAIDLNQLKAGNFSTNRSMEVVLDTGTSLAYLPQDIVEAVARQFGAVLNPSLGMYVLTGQVRDEMPRSVDFVFGDQSIKMSLEDLFWPLSYFTLQASPYQVLTLVSSNQSRGINVLGSSFLRAAYVLFEPDYGQVRLGQFVDKGVSQIVAL